MSDARKAAEDLILLANRFKPLFDAAEALERIGNLEQAEIEAGIRLKNTKDAEADAQTLLEKKNEELAKVNEKISKSQDSIVVMEKMAQDRCDAILRIADEKAAGIVKSANEQKKIVENQIVEKRGLVAQLQEAIDAKNEELMNINREIDAAKEKISGFLK